MSKREHQRFTAESELEILCDEDQPGEVSATWFGGIGALSMGISGTEARCAA
jgi:hypothetical protein